MPKLSTMPLAVVLTIISGLLIGLAFNNGFGAALAVTAGAAFAYFTSPR